MKVHHVPDPHNETIRPLGQKHDPLFSIDDAELSLAGLRKLVLVSVPNSDKNGSISILISV
jgi:hypothetical protein